MNAQHRIWLLIPAIALVACAHPSDASVASTPSTTATAATTQAKVKPKVSALPRMVVTRSPTCGCCEQWIEHAKRAGFDVVVHETDDVLAVKQRVGVPYGKGSCHTAEVAGYFIEGHVPLADVKRLIAEKPRAKGLAVPGMPAGSPGMEMPDGRVQPYAVELVGLDGSTTVYARHGQG